MFNDANWVNITSRKKIHKKALNAREILSEEETFFDSNIMKTLDFAMNFFNSKNCIIFCTLFLTSLVASQDYFVPEATVTVYSPKGFHISIPRKYKTVIYRCNF